MVGIKGQAIKGQRGNTVEELLRCASGCVGVIVLAMQRGAVEPPAAPSPFWALLALLRREPGMGWLPRRLDCCAGSWGPSGAEAGGGEGAGKCGPGGLAACVVGEAGGGLAGSSVGSDPGAGRLQGLVCTAQSIASLWWLCHSQALVSIDGGLGLQKPCSSVLRLSRGLMCCFKEEKTLGFYVC